MFLFKSHTALNNKTFHVRNNRDSSIEWFAGELMLFPPDSKSIRASCSGSSSLAVSSFRGPGQHVLSGLPVSPDVTNALLATAHSHRAKMEWSGTVHREAVLKGRKTRIL